MNNLSIYCEKKYILFEIKDCTKLRDWGMTGQRMEVRCLLKKKSIIFCGHKVYNLYIVYLTSSYLYSRVQSRQTDEFSEIMSKKCFIINIFSQKFMGEKYSIISKSIWVKEIPSSGMNISLRDSVSLVSYQTFHNRVRFPNPTWILIIDCCLALQNASSHLLPVNQKSHPRGEYFGQGRGFQIPPQTMGIHIII